MSKKLFSILLVLLMIAGAFGGCGGAGKAETAEAADTVIIGTIYTADDADTIAKAAAIKDGVYLSVGTEEDIQKYIGDDTEVIRLESGMAMPAFFDAHAHGHEGGVGMLFEVALYEDTSMEEYTKSIRAFIDQNPDVEFLTGGGWVNGYCPPGGPTKEVLDEISSDIPIVINSGDHHSVWANSKAMELAGITADTADVPGGVIERNPATGEPSGTFRENAIALFESSIPDYTVEQYKEGILAYQQEVLTYGITAYYEPMVNLGGSGNLLKAYNELDQEKALKIRVYGGYQILPDLNPMAEVEQCAALKEEAKGGDFEITGIKVLVDGVVEGKTAYLLEDYTSDPGFKGEPLWEQEPLNQAFAKADKLGLQIHTHAIGDAAVKMTIDAYAYAAEKNGSRENRHAITHLQVVDPADIKRMADLKIVAVTNPYWFCKEPGYFYELEMPYLGEARANAEYPMKSFFDEGVVVSAASDYPVTIPSIPLADIQTGITRCDRMGDPATLQNPEQRVTLVQMLRANTINAAYQNFAEDQLGSVEAGKKADLIILDKNLFDTDPFKISDVTVLKTIMGGNTVFSL
ncbi:amidohydrolase [Anoxybacterium hadale]|uniref:Amidohydrolase n=1 Tax=Anoxybacterium hadale TaxID=3408580 RepID=A0ACD1A9F3_9FIRM|nr:amidohydrolase [Clostridiales bacterium]